MKVFRWVENLLRGIGLLPRKEKNRTDAHAEKAWWVDPKTLPDLERNISSLAREKWADLGNPVGQDFCIWLKAEAEVMEYIKSRKL